jgi:hypothetical protein
MTLGLANMHSIDAGEIDGAKLRERILVSASTVTDWASARIRKDRKAGTSVIGEFFSDYEAYCLSRKSRPLLRKIWLASMKMAGFQTQSGGFLGVKLKRNSC